MFQAMYALVLAWLATAPAAPVASPDDAPQAGNTPFVLIQQIDKSSPLLSNIVQPGSFPVAVSTLAEVALDRKALAPATYAAISSATLSLKVYPAKAEEWSMPGQGTIKLPLERFDREKGILYFRQPATKYSLRWPELQYTVDATVRLTLNSPAPTNTDRATRTQATASQLEQTISNWPLTLRRNGKPYRVDITRVKDGARFAFVMYADSEKRITEICGKTDHFRTGQATLTVTPLKAHPKDLVEINPVFNVDTHALVAIESPTHVIGTVPASDQPWVWDPAWAADGKGTKRTTSQPQTKPDLL